MNALLDDIQARLADCRWSWWITRQTTCLANQWAVVPSAEKIELRSERTPSTKQIADAAYDSYDRAASRDLLGWHESRNEYTAMSQRQIADAEYAATLAAGRVEVETEIQAQAVRYVPDRAAIEIVTTRNAGFLIPRQWVGALQDVPTEDLTRLEVWLDGSAIELEDRDIHISVHGLLTATLPAILPPRAVATIFASRGGRATSEAKRSSVQANGRKGGRPRKSARTEAA